MTVKPKENKWIKDLNLNEMKEPLKNLSDALKVIRKEYEKKKKDFIRLKGK